MGVVAQYKSFDKDGNPTADSGQVHLPDELDWMSIDVKVFWYMLRGYGDPTATHVLFASQGEQRLVTLTTPLRYLDHKELKEQKHDIETSTQRYIDEGGFSRQPRNQ